MNPHSISGTNNHFNHEIPYNWNFRDLSPENTAKVLNQSLIWAQEYCSAKGLPNIGIGQLGKQQFQLCNPAEKQTIQLLSAGGSRKYTGHDIKLTTETGTLKSPEMLLSEFKAILTEHLS